jgi:hypothetical protein
LVELIEKKQIKIILVDCIDDADIVLVPISIQYLFLNEKKRAFLRISKEVKNKSKKMLVFSAGDFGKTLLDSHIIQVRLGGFKSKMNKYTYIMPPFIDDPYLTLKRDFEFISKKDKPEIGFVGHSNGSYKKLTKEFVLFIKYNLECIFGGNQTDLQKFYPSSKIRHNFLETLEKASNIYSNFIYRKQYRAGAVNPIDKKATSLEFYDNMYNNLYTFCLRGTGNFSVRFYETLAMGRIPVLINTDCKLPLESVINWNKHALIVDENDVNRLPEILLQFHKSHTKEELKIIQDINRKLWEKQLQKRTYFKILIEQLDNTI